MEPYLILGMPRCQTAWLAEVLSQPGRRCLHEPSKAYRSIADLETALADDKAAISDSMLTFRWRDILRQRPAARIVVVHRPLGEIMTSFERIGLMHPNLFPLLLRLDEQRRALVQHGGVMSVSKKAMEQEETCADIYRWCLHEEMPRRRWLAWSGVKIQANVPEMLAAVSANQAGIRATYPELAQVAA